jgi:flagellar biogenesis protein FliO
MKSTPKWLLIPPVVALLLVLGPLAMGSGADKSAGPAAVEAAPTSSPAPSSAAGGDRGALPGSLVPRTPDMWKMSSALVGVLLLGAVALLGLKKLRGGAAPQGRQTLATLRQTVRLGAKNSLHAVEFDDRILLVGESDKGLTLIQSSALPDAARDEADVLARADVVLGDDDEGEGATPKNLLIPRPDQPAPQRLPSKPRSPRPAQAPAPSKADVAIAKLNDFREILKKATT